MIGHDFIIERKFTVIKESLGRKTSAGKITKPAGLLDWFYILKGITDEDLKLICGTDGALYIVFVRYCAFFFAFISVFNIVLFVPVYATGHPHNIKEI